ncbi:MAG TPA: hypothetical protein VHN14_32650 [Kofleriaceae bacterium]|jgi:hypothetical protein|nr:hypothetical protein [Kofleriaceae bacterium]
MTDRVDIDALLISALYGELTPAEEARLAAHLESHPADRTALADLSETRTAIRESRILSVQFDPPQSVSALLLQEAARRAPRPEREAMGWFHRFTRSFLIHPAMAAAAMFVVVVGVAGTMYMRRGDQFAETAAPVAGPEEARAQAIDKDKASAVAAAAQAENAPAVAAQAQAHTGQVSDDKNRGVAGEPDSRAGSDSYRVGLEESPGQPAPPATAATPPMEQVAQDDRQAPAGRARASTIASSDNERDDEANEAKRGEAKERPLDLPAKPAAPMPAKVATKGNAGIELRSPEMMPKDLDNEADRKAVKVAKKDAARRDLGDTDTGRDRVSKFSDDKLAQAPGAAPAGGGGATAVPGMMPQQNHAAASGPAADPAPAIASNAATGSSTGSSVGAKSKAPAKPTPRPAPPQGIAQSSQPPPLAPPPAPTAAAEPPSLQRDNRRLADKTALGDAKPTEPKAEKADKPAEDKALIDWAQKQRDQVLAFVKSNNCRAAANAAVAIYNRVPGYYTANIETDRLIKPCIAYVNTEREREDRSRAAMKRANAADSPPAAAPAPPARK